MAKIESTPVSLPASADLTAKLFHFGKLVNGQVAACSVLGERSEGVIGPHQTKNPVAGDHIDFYIGRKVTVQASAAFAIGAELTPAATGKAVAAVATNIVRAKALEAATAADQWVDALIVDAYIKP